MTSENIEAFTESETFLKCVEKLKDADRVVVFSGAGSKFLISSIS